MKDAHWKVLGIAGILFLAWFVLQTPQREIQIGGVLLKVEVQDTDSLREKGLSGRESLGENEGMLFVFDEPGRYGFWMKDMNFPIDIIWIDSERTVVEVTKEVAPDTFPKTFYSQKTVRYIVETKAGFTRENNVQPGDKVLGL